MDPQQLYEDGPEPTPRLVQPNTYVNMPDMKTALADAVACTYVADHHSQLLIPLGQVLRCIHQYVTKEASTDAFNAEPVDPLTPAMSDALLAFVQHMLACRNRHSPVERSAFNALTTRLAFWTRTLSPEYILGPIACTYLEKGGRFVCMFGEDHTKNLATTTAAECVAEQTRVNASSGSAASGGTVASTPVMHLHEFLRQWLLRTLVPVDVFLEEDYLDLRVSSATQSYIASLGKTFLTCIRDNKRECYFENVRVHGSDLPRFMYYGARVPGDAVWMTATTRAQVESVLARRTDNLFHTAPESEERYAVFNTLRQEWIERARLQLFGNEGEPWQADMLRFVEPSSRASFMWWREKVRKNWIAMMNTTPAAEHGVVWSALTNVWSETVLHTFFVQFLVTIHRIVSDNPADTFTFDSIQLADARVAVCIKEVNTMFASVFMDVYTLGRMLKCPGAKCDEEARARHIVFHGGAMHMFRYRIVFEQLGFAPMQGLDAALTPVAPFNPFRRKPPHDHWKACVHINQVMPALIKTGALFSPDTYTILNPVLPGLNAVVARLNAMVLTRHYQALRHKLQQDGTLTHAEGTAFANLKRSLTLAGGGAGLLLNYTTAALFGMRPI